MEQGKDTEFYFYAAPMHAGEFPTEDHGWDFQRKGNFLTGILEAFCGTEPLVLQQSNKENYSAP